ncbi:hypothetical protein N9D66_01885, partial [Candidatus Nanopelagicales bacterium]|nr:hypothetical protein [Candidatus Nanopelagicales bacterium]
MDSELTDGAVDLAEILATAGFIAVLTLLSVVVYRAMERPRLVLTQTSDGPRAQRSDIVKYVLSIPILVLSWVSFFGIIIFVAPVQSSARTQLLMPIAIVIAIRLLAHVNLSGAYHLSSVLPMVILASLVLGEGLPDETELQRLFDESQGLEVTLPAVLSVYVLEFLFTFAWYWAKRWQFARRRSVVGAENLSGNDAPVGPGAPSQQSSVPQSGADGRPDPAQWQQRADAGEPAAEADQGAPSDPVSPTDATPQQERLAPPD